jgi:outer membrane lipoprotein LolB
MQPARAVRLLAGSLAAGSILLAGCASAPGSGERLPGGLISGRISIRVDASDHTDSRAVNAAFELEGNPQFGRLNLSTPLGTVLAQVSWSPGQALLVTPEERTPYADLDSLTERLLGESVPVAALFDWLRGRPWPDAASQPNPATAGPGFVQLGWDVSLANFADALVLARRERPPVVTVRAKLDRP